MTYARTAALMLPLLFAAGCNEYAIPTAPTGDSDHSVVLAKGQVGLRSTIADLLGSGTRPVAIAHRGMGPNLGEDESRPIENTVAAVRQGYEAGAAVVELDLQMTADGEVVVWHDDFLEDYTCFNTLTRDELEARAPHIVSFQAVLQTAKRYNRQSEGGLSGLLTVDIKPSSPLCDPEDTEGAEFVSRVVSVVRQMGAEDLIYFNSMSPVLLGLAAAEAPEIPRQLTVLLLQLLTPEQVEGATGLPVTIIDKEPSYGLRWAEVGPIHRLPGYDSPEQAIMTALATQSQIISYDLQLLGLIEQAQAGGAAALVDATRALGLHVFAGDVSEASDWHFGASLDVGALYADDVPLAVALQGPLN